MKARNDEISSMIDACEQHLDNTGLLGYACAYNARKLMLETVEYKKIKDEAIKKYGEEVKDDDGNLIGYSISPHSDSLEKYKEYMSKYDSIEHNVDIFVVDSKDLIGTASGKDMLALDFMIDWGDDRPSTQE